MRNILKHITFLLLVCSTAPAVAQLKIVPIKKEAPDPDASQARIQQDAPLNLPFWDDFSFTGTQPAEKLWQNSSGIYVNQGLARNPPTLGVASFDGIQASGTGYNSNGSGTGKTDSLTSRPIDLSSLSPTDNVYLSFFYQYAGAGEIPDEGDSLRLEFLNSNNEWVSIWPGSNPLNSDREFVQVIQKVNDLSFFHNHFQFRFQSFGRQSGPYDVWNIDYVYLNKNRNESDLFYPDRAVATPLTSILKNYTALPMAHFSVEDLTEPTFTAYSLDNSTDDPQPYTYDLLIDIVHYQDSNETLTARDSLEIKPEVGINSRSSPLAPQERDTISVPNILRTSDLDADADSAALHYRIIFNSNDNKTPLQEGDYLPEVYSPVDFRSNDTTFSSFILSNYYAYDDGTAEYAAALNTSGSRLAYKFDLAKDTIAHVVAFDLYFPFVGTDPAGKEIELNLWQSINVDSAASSTLLHQESVIIQRDPELNSLIRYHLNKPVKVTGSFYIGYQQKTSGELGIGLDKNTDSASKIYYNIAGTWQQNSIITGSLMMRPVFGAPVDSLATGLDPEAQHPVVKIYPNPASDHIHISGKHQQIGLYDLRGVAQEFSFHFDGVDTVIDLKGLPTGVYLLKIQYEDKVQIVKFLKE